MGRHSAPDEDGGDAADLLVTDRNDAVDEARGRHSSGPARDAAGDAASAAWAAAAAEAERADSALGSDVAPDSEPGGLAILDEAGTVAAEPAKPAKRPKSPKQPKEAKPAKEPKPARAGGGTRADIRLMRGNHTLLVRCLAAIIIPFVLYTLVLLVIGKLGAYALWVWIPAILAGVLVGAFLDSAHKLGQQDAPPPGDRRPDPPVAAP